MTIIGIGQLRGDARHYVERAELGETFEILRRGRRVARLHAIDLMREPLVIPVKLDDIRSRAGRLCDRVAAGEALAIELRGRPVAMYAIQPAAVS